MNGMHGPRRIDGRQQLRATRLVTHGGPGLGPGKARMIVANPLTNTRDTYAGEVECLQVRVAEEAVVDARKERSNGEHWAEGEGRPFIDRECREGATTRGVDTGTSQRCARRGLVRHETTHLRCRCSRAHCNAQQPVRSKRPIVSTVS